MKSIRVAVIEFMEGGKALWVHNNKGMTVLRIQCTGNIKIDNECTNVCAHSDINVVGDINICIPNPKKI